METESQYAEYSVLMSVYRKDIPEFLKLSIESMLNQSALCNQFIIVEDGPIPDSLENVISYYENRYADIFTIVRLSQNKGLGNALNQGMKYSRCELICRMDADDISYPERCKKQLMKFQENSSLCILGTQINEFVGSVDTVISSRIVPCSYDDIRKFARRRSPFNHPTVMYKKSVIEGIGGYPTLNRKEDLELFIKAVNEGCYSENLDEVLLYYRTSEENQKRRKSWINCREYIQVMYGFYKKKYINFVDLLYVTIGQIIMFILPWRISKRVTMMFLRS